MAAGKSTSFNLGLSQLPETQGPDFSEFIRMYNAVNILAYYTDIYTGQYDYSPTEIAELDPTDTLLAGNLNKVYVRCDGTVTQGQPVRLNLGAGVLSCVRAQSNTSVNMADGFAMASGTAGDIIQVTLGSGINPYVGSGLTIGQRYWVSSATPGNLSTAATNQYFGIAVSDELVWCNISQHRP